MNLVGHGLFTGRLFSIFHLNIGALTTALNLLNNSTITSLPNLVPYAFQKQGQVLMYLKILISTLLATVLFIN